MVKRRRLETPSSADLSRIEEQFRSETSLPSLGRGIAPIAQVAAESAAVASPESAAARAARAKAEADAARLQEAETRGLLIAEGMPLAQVVETIGRYHRSVILLRGDQLGRRRVNAVLDRHRWRGGACATRAASSCRASLQATRRGRRVSIPCCPTAGERARAQGADAAAPASRPGG